MKKEDISEIISGIDDKFIDEAATGKIKRFPVKKVVAAAACISLAVLSAVLLANSGILDPKTPPAGENSSSQEESANLNKYPEGGNGEIEIATDAAIDTPANQGGEMVIVPQWDELSITMKYGEFRTDDITYHTMTTEIPSESVGEFLYSTEMQGYDIYTDTAYTVNAQIYSVKTVLTDCAVAVKFEEDDKYYVYTNSYYTPETLGDMIDDLNLRETLSFGKAYSDFRTENAQIFRTYEDFDDSIVWEMLLSDEAVKNVSYDRFYEKIVGISVDIPLLGFRNISLGVTKDGYLVTNIMSTQKCFFIGEEKAEAFGEYLESNIKFTEAVTVMENPDGTIPGKEDMGQSTPGYNPNLVAEETTKLN